MLRMIEHLFVWKYFLFPLAIFSHSVDAIIFPPDLVYGSVISNHFWQYGSFLRTSKQSLRPLSTKKIKSLCDSDTSLEKNSFCHCADWGAKDPLCLNFEQKWSCSTSLEWLTGESWWVTYQASEALTRWVITVLRQTVMTTLFPGRGVCCSESLIHKNYSDFKQNALLVIVLINQ